MQPVKIAIISDLHVMAPELLVSEGNAFDEYLARDRKMLRESAEILDTQEGCMSSSRDISTSATSAK